MSGSVQQGVGLLRLLLQVLFPFEQMTNGGLYINDPGAGLRSSRSAALGSGIASHSVLEGGV